MHLKPEALSLWLCMHSVRRRFSIKSNKINLVNVAPLVYYGLLKELKGRELK